MMRSSPACSRKKKLGQSSYSLILLSSLDTTNSCAKQNKQLQSSLVCFFRTLGVLVAHATLILEVQKPVQLHFADSSGGTFPTQFLLLFDETLLSDISDSNIGASNIRGLHNQHPLDNSFLYTNK
jgi:hypothetical protein